MGMKLDIIFNADELSPEWAKIMQGVDSNAKKARKNFRQTAKDIHTPILKRTKSKLKRSSYQ